MQDIRVSAGGTIEAVDIRVVGGDTVRVASRGAEYVGKVFILYPDFTLCVSVQPDGTYMNFDLAEVVEVITSAAV